MVKVQLLGLFQLENYNNKTERFKSLSDFATRHDKTWTDLGCQLEFALQEMYGEVDGQRYYDGWISVGYTIEQFKQFTDVNLATEIFERSFERAGTPMMFQRIQYANEYYTKLTGYSESYTTPGVSVNQIEGWGTNPNGRTDFVIANFDESRWISGVPTKQMNQTAAEYIANVLCKYAITDTHSDYEDESPGFKYYVTAEGHHFEAINYNADDSVEKVNIEYGTQNSDIISFSISKIGSIAMLGYDTSKNNIAYTVESSALSDLYADEITQGAENIYGVTVSDESKKETEEYTNWWSFKNKARPVSVVSSSTENELGVKVSETFNNMASYANQAELTVWGDYSNRFTAGGYVDITVYGQEIQHYSSGIYMIIKIQDSITQSGYTQTLKLLKNVGRFNQTNTKVVQAIQKGITLLNDVVSEGVEKVKPIRAIYGTVNTIADKLTKSGKTKE